jgi:hypothetical protein
LRSDPISLLIPSGISYGSTYRIFAGCGLSVWSLPLLGGLSAHEF